MIVPLAYSEVMASAAIAAMNNCVSCRDASDMNGAGISDS